jgi:hypothetical protein
MAASQLHATCRLHALLRPCATAAPSAAPRAPFRAFAATPKPPRRTLTPLRASASDDASAAALPGLAETAALDELIDILLAATDATDLSQKVAENMLSFDQRFWLRLATRTDSADDEEEKDRLASLARVVMQLVDAIMRKTNAQLTDSAAVLQEILRAGADERTGEWTLPLPADKVKAMRAAMDARADSLDEALLSNCFAWMRKASDDKLDGMVTLLQIVLQLYASRALTLAASSSKSEEGSEAAISALLGTEEGRWAVEIRGRAREGTISEVSFLEALQRRMEAVVLGLSSGSYAQRVQAEYLKELETRAKEVFADLAAGR